MKKKFKLGKEILTFVAGAGTGMTVAAGIMAIANNGKEWFKDNEENEENMNVTEDEYIENKEEEITEEI